MRSEAAVLCADADMRHMLEMLCAIYSAPEIVVADGEDSAVRGEAEALARSRGVPLIFIGGPADEPDSTAYVLPRPLCFSDFREVIQTLHSDTAGPVRAAAKQSEILRWDGKHRMVICGETQLTLTPREADVFALLYEASPAPVSGERLMEGFSRTDGNGPAVYISYLRRKLASLPQAVTVTFVRGRGYALLMQSAE